MTGVTSEISPASPVKKELVPQELAHPYTDDMRAMVEALESAGYLGRDVAFETIAAGITPTGIAGEGYDARRLKAAQIAAGVGNKPEEESEARKE